MLASVEVRLGEERPNMTAAAAVTNENKPALTHFGLLAACFGLFYVLNVIGKIGAPLSPQSIVLLVAVALPAIRLRARDLPSQFVVIAYAINGCCVFYLIGMHRTYDLGLPPLFNSVWVPVFVGMLAFRWPALIALPALAARWAKIHTQFETGLGAPNSADFVIIPDLALFLSIAVSIYAVYRILEDRLPVTRVRKETFFNACIMMASGIHLSNYFHSGWEKLFLPDSTPLTWVLQNPTYFLAIHSTDAGALTILDLFPDRDTLVPFLTWLNIPLNAWVLVIQLYALVSLLSLRGSAWLTFLYDVMHVGIFVLTGIFFWKWIVLNVAFILAFQKMQKGERPSVAIRCLACVIVLVAPILSFHIVKLAWFDTGGVNDAYFEVANQKGEILRVPSNFFLNKSINVAQQRIARPTNGFLPTGTWGTTNRASIMFALRDHCSAEARDWALSDEQKTQLGKMVRAHQALVVSLADESGRVAYDFYPHHIWSAPWLFDDFAKLDVRQIRSYFFVVESRCVSVGTDGQVIREPVRRERYEFKL